MLTLFGRGAQIRSSVPERSQLMLIMQDCGARLVYIPNWRSQLMLTMLGCSACSGAVPADAHDT